MNRYIVTGGAGFIGSALVRALLAEGHSVHVVDNLSTGNIRNLDEVAGRVTLHTLDICDYDHLAPIIAGAHRVFHIAAIPSVPKSIDNPGPSHASNINGTPSSSVPMPITIGIWIPNSGLAYPASGWL